MKSNGKGRHTSVVMAQLEMRVTLTLSARAQQRAASNMNSSRLLDIACVLSAGKKGGKYYREAKKQPIYMSPLIEGHNLQHSI